MTPQQPHPPGRVRRTAPRRWALAAALSGLLAGLLVTVVTLTAPARPALAGLPKTDPLLLVHGLNDDCFDAFGHADPARGSDDVATVSYLQSAGFTWIDKVGYYTNANNYTDILDTHKGGNGALDYCDHNLNQLVGGDANMAQCNNLPGPASAYGSKDDHIDRLGCLLAWYIYENFSQHDQPVNVLAHSMGGLIIRDAIGRTTARAAYFPPMPLQVSRVVTVATPHGGIYGGYLDTARTSNLVSGQELEDMNPAGASGFMNMISQYQRPQGAAGTQWSLLGASDAPYTPQLVSMLINCFVQPNGYPLDGGNYASCYLGADGDSVVPAASQMGMQADYKVLYGVRSGLALSVADLGTQYEHEYPLPTQTFGPYTVEFNGPFYLNDARTGTVTAWRCDSACFDTSIPSGSPVSGVRYSLATIVERLTVPAAGLAQWVFRSAYNNDYVSAEVGWTGNAYAQLRARSTTQGAWEGWDLITLTDGSVAFMSRQNGDYVSAEIGWTGNDYGKLRARASAIGPWEKFQIVWNSDGTYSIKSLANNEFVSAEVAWSNNDYADLRARAGSIGAWERFTPSTAPPPNPCANYGGTGDITGPNPCDVNTFSTVSTWFSSRDQSTHPQGVGYMGQELWTYANGTVPDSTAHYHLYNLSKTARLQLQAYIPNDDSDATHAHYHYCAPGGGCADGYVDQTQYTNQWAAIGYFCTSDGTVDVTLADDGGDTYPAVVGADAIRAVHVTGPCS
jgi:hypothetical protein